MDSRVNTRRSFTLIALAFGSIILAASPRPATASVAEKLPIEVIYQAKAPIVIPVSGKVGHATVDLPTVPKVPGKVLVVRFKAFYPVEKYIDKLADYYLKIDVNGKTLGASLPDEADRVLNRSKLSRDASGEHPIWNDDKLGIVFGHETGEMDPRILDNRDEGYWLVLNISDVGEYVWTGADNSVIGGRPNRIEFTSGRTDASPNPIPKEMRVEDLTMGYLPKEIVDKLAPVASVEIPRLAGKKLKSGGFALTVAPSGAMSIESGKETYAFRAAYSYPGETMQFHRFTWEEVKDADWSITEAAGGNKGLSITGESAGYSVTRTITPKDGKFYVSDMIENKTDAPLGMAVRYDVASSGRMNLDETYLSGVPGIRNNSECGQNPTVFLRNAGGSLGIVAEDDVLAYQLSMIKKPNSVQFGAEHFGLEPHKSYTIAWTLYPSKDQDYFGFINRVRRDWNLNTTIPGMFVCSPKASPGINIRYHALPPWFGCLEGVALTEDEYLKRLKSEVDALTAVQPDVVCMPELETPEVGLRRSKIPDGDKIPKTPKLTNLELNEEQSNIVKNAAGPLWDSMTKGKNGHAVIDTWYSGFAVDDDFNITGYPAPGNSWYNHILKQVDLTMDKVGCKGIYLDSFEYGYDFNGSLDYTKWDGHSVNLDNCGNIADKMTEISMASAPGRAGILKYIMSKGGESVTNGHPVARELRSLPYMSFVETDWDQVPDFDALLKLLTPEEPRVTSHMAMGHLCSCPVACGIAMWRSDIFGSPPAPKDFGINNAAEIQQKYVIACMRNGQLVNPYGAIPKEGPGKGEYGIMTEMFPFTTVELHEGYLIGKEKILTAVSGTFLWNISDHPAKPSICKAYDNKGYATTPKSFEVTKVGRQWKVRLELKQDWMGTAAIY